MFKKRPSPALVVSLLALLVSLGGTSYAASTGRLLPANSVGTRQVIDHSLLSRDFKPGQLPRGPQGPAGPQGAAGPQGPAGSARDVGSVSPGDATHPVGFYSFALKGWTSVTRIGTGQYCLTPDSTATLQGSALVVSLGSQGGGGGGSVVWEGYCSPANAAPVFEVLTVDHNGMFTNNLPFTAIIP